MFPCHGQGEGTTLTDDKIDDETYSLIFTSLKHPIRRRILRMLAEKPLTFSQIQEALAVDSGHLSYHLESLGDLIMRPGNEKYQLSSFGDAAVRLMGGVEEHSPKPSHRRTKVLKVLGKVYPLALAAVVIMASFIFLTYATPTVTTDSWLTQFPSSGDTFFSLRGGSTVEFNVTMIYVKTDTTHGVIGVEGVGTDALTFQKSALVNNLTTTEAGSLWLDLAVDRNQLFHTINISNPATLSVGFANEDLNISVALSRPDQTLETDTFSKSYISFNTDHFTFPAVDASESGTYRFEITNLDSQDLNVTLQPNIKWQLMEKPYFYYGAAGMTIAVVYLGIASTMLIADYRASIQSEKRRRIFGAASSSKNKNRRLFVGVTLLVIVVVTIPLSTYALADNAVGNALNSLQVTWDSSGGFYQPDYVLYHTHFLITDTADLNLNLNLNFTAYATQDEQSPRYLIGNAFFENQNARSNRALPIQLSFNTTSTEAVNIMRGRSSFLTVYSITVTAEGSYLFWHITKQKTFNFTWVNPIF
jgi:DNA-binding transcriptional ArsR family regulator